MGLITLLSDYGLRDNTVARLKVRVLRRIENIEIVDISHLVEPHNILEAAHILRGVYRDFPKGTIHLVMVGTSPQEGGEYICLKSNGQYFLGTNNGLLTSVLREEKFTGARSLDIRGINPDDEKEILAAAAAHLSDGGKMDVLGPALSSVKRLKEQVPGVNEHAISGNVVYVDRFGTCMTNISKAMFTNHVGVRKFSVELSRGRSMKKIYDRIADVPQGKLAALWNEEGMLAIAIGKSGGEHIRGSDELLGMKVHDWVRIDMV
ncbi:MAG: SAM hydrolase/SAM-dependent halogenase family protein [Schleiferiaceae bacterium]